MTVLMTNLLAALVTGSQQHPYLGAFVLVVMGIVVFLLGFKQYREYRILADAPRAHVRSIPMGLVHLRGKATGEPLISPLTGSRCFMFMVDIEEWVKTRAKGGGTKWAWRTTAGDDDLKQFYLDDGTGRVLVNPVEAEERERDLQRTFSCEVGKEGHFKSVRPTPGIPAPTEQAVWAYINGAHSRKLLDKVFELEGERGRMMKSFMESSLKVMNAVQQIENLGVPLQSSTASGLRGGPYRVTEKCFLADSECVIVGTCAENPDAKSDEDRNIIRKGQNEKTFLISTQGEGKLGRNLRLQAVGLVLLGGALIIGAAALALSAAGLF
jgi:hypothetical protein